MKKKLVRDNDAEFKRRVRRLEGTQRADSRKQELHERGAKKLAGRKLA